MFYALKTVAYVEKYGIALEATDYKMARALFMLDNYVYKRAPRMCNTYCFSTAAMVAQTWLSVT